MWGGRGRGSAPQLTGEAGGGQEVTQEPAEHGQGHRDPRGDEPEGGGEALPGELGVGQSAPCSPPPQGPRGWLWAGVWGGSSLTSATSRRLWGPSQPSRLSQAVRPSRDSRSSPPKPSWGWPVLFPAASVPRKGTHSSAQRPASPPIVAPAAGLGALEGEVGGSRAVTPGRGVTIPPPPPPCWGHRCVLPPTPSPGFWGAPGGEGRPAGRSPGSPAPPPLPPPPSRLSLGRASAGHGARPAQGHRPGWGGGWGATWRGGILGSPCPAGGSGSVCPSVRVSPPPGDLHPLAGSSHSRHVPHGAPLLLVPLQHLGVPFPSPCGTPHPTDPLREEGVTPSPPSHHDTPPSLCVPPTAPGHPQNPP